MLQEYALGAQEHVLQTRVALNDIYLQLARIVVNTNLGLNPDQIVEKFSLTLRFEYQQRVNELNLPQAYGSGEWLRSDPEEGSPFFFDSEMMKAAIQAEIDRRTIYTKKELND